MESIRQTLESEFTYAEGSVKKVCSAEIVEKEDLSLEDHLSGRKRPFIKLSFDNSQQMRDGLDTVEIEALTAEQSGLPNLGGTDPAVPMHMGDAILHSARSQGLLSGQGAWSATGLVDGLSENARSLLHLVTTSVIPVPRASAGRLLNLDLASLARACAAALPTGGWWWSGVAAFVWHRR